jgi:hypothetical protein
VTSGVVYVRAFFDLQLQFAETVSVLSGLPLTRALLGYTNHYVRFGLGRASDPAHPLWLEYGEGERGARLSRVSWAPDESRAPGPVLSVAGAHR